MRDTRLHIGNNQYANIAILLRHNGVVRYVVGVVDESKYFADPSLDYEVIFTEDLPTHVAMSSFQYSMDTNYYGHTTVKALENLPRWARNALVKLRLIEWKRWQPNVGAAMEEGYLPAADFVLCKAKSSTWNLKKLEKRLTTALVCFEPRHNAIMVSWMPGSLLRRTWRFGHSDTESAIKFAEQLIELSKNIINTHIDLTNLAEEYGKKTKPLGRWRSWKRKEAYRLLPEGDSL